MANTKCPATYKNLGLETFGNKKKVTEELLKQLCKNDEYLYQQVRFLLDSTDPETRNRFYPPTFDNELKSFGYTNGTNNDRKCYKFNDGEQFVYQVDFDTSDDCTYRSGHIIYNNDESIIDYKKTGSGVHIFVDEEGGHARIPELTGIRQAEVLVKEAQIIETVTPHTITEPSTTIESDGKVVLDSSYTQNRTFDSEDPIENRLARIGLMGSSVGSLSKYKMPSGKLNGIAESQRGKGYPIYACAQTFTAQNNGWITEVYLMVDYHGKSGTEPPYPFICEIWETKDGVPYGGALTRVEKYINNVSYERQKFTFDKQVSVTKGKQYAIVMKGSYTVYFVGGFDSTEFTNYATTSKNTGGWAGYNSKVISRKHEPYPYGKAYGSSNNGESWYSPCNNDSYTDTAIAQFWFEVYVQPTKEIVTETEVVEYITTLEEEEAVYEIVDVPYAYYPVGNHYIYFNIPSTNPITFLSINNLTDDDKWNGQEILFDISYNGKDWNNDYHMSNSIDGTGSYDLTSDKPVFVCVRCNLKNTDDTKTPELTNVEFIVDTEASTKAYIRSLPYFPVQEDMLCANIWSEIGTYFENDTGTNVKVDIVREVTSQERFSIRKDTVEDLILYYNEYYPESKNHSYNDEQFRELIHEDEAFLEYLKNKSPSIYVVSALPDDDVHHYKYFDSIELSHYPAYPTLICDKLLKEITVPPRLFYDKSKYNAQRTEYTLKTNVDLEHHLTNIVFQEPMASEIENHEGTLDNVLIEGVDYRIEDDNIIFILNGDNISNNIVRGGNGEVKCYQTSGGIHDIIDDKDLPDFDTDADIIPYLGNVVKLTLNLQQNSYKEHMHYDIDYDNKLMKLKPSMENDLDTCELLISYNPLWVRDLDLKDFPLKMDLWTEHFVVKDGQKTFTLKTTPVDDLREVVLFDEEDSLTRKVLEEEVDFIVDYVRNTFTLLRDVEDDTPITVRYTPNLRDNKLSLAYRMDRNDVYKQAYIYSNYFTTRT